MRDATPARRRRETSRPSPPPPRTPSRGARPLPGRRRWWSLRGLGPLGIIGRLVTVFLAVVLVWGIAGFIVLRNATADANGRVSNTARAALSDPGGGLLGTPENTVVIGSDADRGRTGARADTVMIMRTNPKAGTINYLSIPRDLRVNLPEFGHMKITEAYSHRGIRGVISAIRSELGVPIHHVMVIDFKGVSRMVDAVGGITVDNPFNLQNCAYPGGRTVTFNRGKLELDGPRALEYSRVRSCDSDIERARRQQLVVAALKSKTLSWTSLPMAPFRGAKIVRTMSTDMGTTDIAKFGWLQGRLKTGSREVLATDGAYFGDVSYQVLRTDAAEEQIAAFMGG